MLPFGLKGTIQLSHLKNILRRSLEELPVQSIFRPITLSRSTSDANLCPFGKRVEPQIYLKNGGGEAIPRISQYTGGKLKKGRLWRGTAGWRRLGRQGLFIIPWEPLFRRFFDSHFVFLQSHQVNKGIDARLDGGLNHTH